jgi:hypothetical protein
VLWRRETHYLGLDKMTDPNFGHDGNRNSLDNLLDHVGVTLEREKSRKVYVLVPRCTVTKPRTCHTRDTACSTNICRHTL